MPNISNKQKHIKKLAEAKKKAQNDSAKKMQRSLLTKVQNMKRGLFKRFPQKYSTRKHDQGHKNLAIEVNLRVKTSPCYSMQKM